MSHKHSLQFGPSNFSFLFNGKEKGKFKILFRMKLKMNLLLGQARYYADQ